MNIQRGKAVCRMYKNGSCASEIAKALNITNHAVYHYLDVYYEKIYDERYITFSEKRKKRLDELYDKYKRVYVQGAFTKAQLCKTLDCTIHELEDMLRKNNLNNQWHKTYANQVTLCNTSKEFRNSIKEFAKEHNYRSVREVVVEAINEFMLFHQMTKEE